MYTNKLEASIFYPQALAIMSITHKYSLPRDLESQAWLTYLGTSHHLNPNSSYLHIKKLYSCSCRVYVTNGQPLTINFVGSSYVYMQNLVLHTLLVLMKFFMYLALQEIYYQSPSSQKIIKLFLSSLLINVVLNLGAISSST